MSSPLLESTKRFEPSTNCAKVEGRRAKREDDYHDRLQESVDRAEEIARELRLRSEAISEIANSSELASELISAVVKDLTYGRNKTDVKYEFIISGAEDYCQILLLILCVLYIPILLFWS